MIKSTGVALHYSSHEVQAFDPWSVIGAVMCPVLVLAGEDDPVCPLPVVQELVNQCRRKPPARAPSRRAPHIFRDRRTSLSGL